jgi:hypothetical protein
MPHEAPGNPNNYEIVLCYHEGGGSLGGVQASGCLGDGTPIQEAILEVQRFLGTPNAVGGKGIVLGLINYRLTNFSAVPSAPNLFPTQWQDAKCPVWYILANPSSFPGNKSLIGIYGPSWGAIMAWWAAATPDNAYPPSCAASAPSTEPQFRIVNAWNPMAWLNAFGNAGYDHGNVAFQHAMQGQLNSANRGVMQSNCDGMTPGCDPANGIVQANIAVYQNVQVMMQFGANDPVVVPSWGSGPTQGGNMYQVASAFAALSPPIHPFLELIPNCAHICDIGTINSPSQADAFNFLLMTANTTTGGMNSSGLGGS